MGEVWKYGITCRPERRYTKKWLREKKLQMIPQSTGNEKKVRQKEAEKIIEYQRMHNGDLPPGNKIIGKIFKLIKFLTDENSKFI